MAKKTISQQDQIHNLKKKQEKIELVLENATNEKLHEKYTQKWSEIEEKIEELQQQTERPVATRDKSKELVAKAKILFENPLSLWECGNPNIRYLLLAVRS